MNQSWIAERMRSIDISGIRKVFDLAAKIENPINLSIGQPDFDVPEPIKEAAAAAMREGFNGYTVTQGIPELREKLTRSVDATYHHVDRQVLVTSGTSGGLLLALSVLVNPGDEVIVFDPYFVSYNRLVTLVGGTTVYVDTYPDFRIDIDKVRAAITKRTKCILVNSPGNPTGAVASEEELRELAELARGHDIPLVSDEVYRVFCYDRPFHSPAEWNEDVIVVDGFSKAYGMTGWRLGYAHGPAAVIAEMTKLQQFSFVCAPSIVQKAGVVALDLDVSQHVADYRRKRDLIVGGLSDLYEIQAPEGAFYIFPKAPWGTGTEFVTASIEHGLLAIPGNVFSRRDTHFRLSYAASDETLRRGIEVLRRLAKK